MARKGRFDISEEEMELIKLRRIRAEEARKRSGDAPRKKKTSSRDIDDRRSRPRRDEEERSRRRREDDERGRLRRDEEDRNRRRREDERGRSRRDEEERNSRKRREEDDRVRSRRDEEERNRRRRREEDDRVHSRRVEEDRRKRQRREEQLSEEEELRRIRREEKQKLSRENNQRRNRAYDDSFYRDYDEEQYRRRKKKSDDWDDINAEEESYRKRKAAKNAKNSKKKWSKKKKILVGILIGIGAAALAFFLVITFVPGAKTALAQLIASTDAGKSLIKDKIKDKYEANIWDKEFDSNKVEINSGLNLPDNYRNIALFGLDARDIDVNAANHADTMMVLSINMDNFETKMASIYRDTHLKMTCESGEVFYDKANSAYFRGGPLLNINMLNTCFDLNITDYVVVNFAGISKIVDAVGGLDVVVDDDEIEQINYYLNEARYLKGYDPSDQSILPDLSYSKDGSGIQTLHLNGDYVTAYCRNRYTVFTDKVTGEQANSDMARTARQRYVLSLLVSKIKSGGISGILSASDAILSANTAEEQFIKSSMDVDEVVDVIAAALEMSFSNTMGVPEEYGSMDGSSDLVPKDLEYNAKVLHEYLFDQTNYSCTSALKKISNEISSRTGLYR